MFITYQTKLDFKAILASPSETFQVNFFLTGFPIKRLNTFLVSPILAICLAQPLLATCFMLVSSFAYSSSLKMEAICSSVTLVDFKLATWRYIPGDRTLHGTV
jgi:hypothetical protein